MINTLLSHFVDYDHFTLTVSEIYNAAIVFSLILTGICIFGLIVFGKDQKKLAWTLSVVNSFVMSVLGVLYLKNKLPEYNDFFLFGDNGLAPFNGRTNITVLIALWFGLANVFDLVFGFVFYRKYLGVLTAYVHHTVFIWIMWTMSTGNGFFIHPTPFGPCFGLLLIEEIPTFLLAFGSINSAFRTDLGFGLSFFLLRICYHIYFFIYAFKSGAEVIILVLFSLTLAMHVSWFWTWFSKYSGLFGAAVKDKKKEKQEQYPTASDKLKLKSI